MRPPENVEPSELFQKLLSATPPSEVIDFPRRGPDGKPIDQVRVQVVESTEHDRARIDATAKLKARGLSDAELSSPAIREVLGDAIAKEMIAQACLTVKGVGDPDNPLYGRIFRDARDVDRLRADEIVVLFNAHLLVQKKYGPFEGNLSKEDVDAWILRLGAGASEFPLSQLAWLQLAELAQSLAARLYTLSRILESQLESLPNTLASSLESYVLGTTSAGEPADEHTVTTSESSEVKSALITTETATELAKKMRDRS